MFPSLIIANLLAALFIWIAAPTAISAKRAQAHVLYEELRKDGVLIDRAGYDAETKFRQLAGDNGRIISGFHLASAISFGNALMLFIALRKIKNHPTQPTS